MLSYVWWLGEASLIMPHFNRDLGDGRGPEAEGWAAGSFDQQQGGQCCQNRKKMKSGGQRSQITEGLEAGSVPHSATLPPFRLLVGSSHVLSLPRGLLLSCHPQDTVSMTWAGSIPLWLISKSPVSPPDTCIARPQKVFVG